MIATRWRLRNAATSIAVLGVVTAAGAGAQNIAYPASPRGPTVDTYFGVRIADPYRWLENLAAPTTRAWIDSQNKFTESYFAQLPLRDTLRKRLRELSDYPRGGVPTVLADGRLIAERNTGLQSHAALYTRTREGAASLVLDASTLSKDGSVTLHEWSPSSDGRMLAYTTSEQGSNWSTIHVRDLVSTRDLADTVRWARASTPSWTQDGRGFYYSRYPQPAAGKELVAAVGYATAYYHKVGTPQAADRQVLPQPELATHQVTCGATSDGKYAYCSARSGADNRNQLYVADLGDPMRPDIAATFVPLVTADSAQFIPLGNIGPTMLVKTNARAANGRIVAFDMSAGAAASSHARTVVAESKYPITSATISGGRIVVQYVEDVKSVVRLFDLDGHPLGAVPLPGIGTVTRLSGTAKGNELYFGFTSLLVPMSVYCFDVATHVVTPVETPAATFNPRLFETREIFATSKDGTRIPVFVAMKAGTHLDGSHPTILDGDGGFGTITAPEFDPSIIAWIERGGIYAIASVRGGGEYGETWHKAGALRSKQNSFDDFIAASEFLISQRYTAPSKLAIRGASNGGLLMGAVSNQRTDLYAVVLSDVGLFDMLRYDRLGGGAAYVGEYGSASDSTMFPSLYAYSPLHNVRPGVCHPATYASATDRDERVPPSHTLKYVAALQAAQGCARPALARIESGSGHRDESPDSKIAAAADRLTFAWTNMP